MNDSTLFALLDLPPDGADFDQVARLFIDHVKSCVQQGVDTYDDTEVRQQEEYLSSLFPKFFEFTVYWIRDEMARNKDVKNHPDATKLRTEAKTVLRGLQDNIISFTIVYMHINRFMTLVRDEIKKSDAKSINYDGKKKIKWTGDTGVLLGRHKKRKASIERMEEKFESAIPLLREIEPVLKEFDTATAAALGRDDAVHVQNTLRAGLRVGNFTRARSAASEITARAPRFSIDRKSSEDSIKVLAAQARDIVTFFENHAETLVSEDGKFFLKESELRIIQDSMALEMRKIRAYIVKYNLPYMEYKLDQLSSLRDKLMIIGGLDSLMTLYLRLVVGMARPMVKLEDVRLYEAEVLGPIKFLQAGQFAEISKIHDAARKTVAEFSRVRQEYHTELDKLSAEEDAATLLENLAEG